MSIKIYSFYNNKGGVGKTTLCQNAACLYAENNPDKKVLVIDLCPQANISQFLLGGGHKGYETCQKLQASSSRKNIVGFIDWLLKGNSGFTAIRDSYAVQAAKYNASIASNLYLIAGDSFLESLSLALNYAVINPANLRAWKEFATAIRRLCELEVGPDFESMTVFIDCNPSFSIYTQMGLVSSDSLIVPMMADFSSLEGIKGVLTLLYGEYPSAAAKKYAEDFVTFHRKVAEHRLDLPTFYEFVFNSFTSNSGVATAYDAIRSELIDFSYLQFTLKPHLFDSVKRPAAVTKADWERAFLSNTKDFHTSGKVSASLGIPLHRLPDRQSYTMPDGEVVRLPSKNYEASLDHMQTFTARIQ